SQSEEGGCGFASAGPVRTRRRDRVPVSLPCLRRRELRDRSTADRRRRYRPAQYRLSRDRVAWGISDDCRSALGAVRHRRGVQNGEIAIAIVEDDIGALHVEFTQLLQLVRLIGQLALRIKILEAIGGGLMLAEPRIAIAAVKPHVREAAGRIHE